MDTIRDKGKRYHVGCGGEIHKGLCVKCGEKDKGLLRKILGEGPLVIKEGDEQAAKRKAHKARIREGRDIFK